MSNSKLYPAERKVKSAPYIHRMCFNSFICTVISNFINSNHCSIIPFSEFNSIAEVIPVNPQRVSRGNRARCETGDVRNVGKIGIHFKMVNYIAVLIQSDINTQRLNPVGVSQRRVHDFIQRNILVDINPFRGIVLSCR